MDQESIHKWARDSISTVRKEGINGLGEPLRPIYYKTLHLLSKVSIEADHIYDLDWDLLVVIDASRHDLFVETASDYAWVDSVSSITSIDTMTPEWMRKTFTEDRRGLMSETTYVCGNPFSEKLLSETDFFRLDEAWRYQWDSDIGTIHPRPLTDRTIQFLRDEDPKRAIVHYMQPHWPFVRDPHLTEGKGIELEGFGTHDEHDIWERLRRGEVSRESVWDGYRRNLEFVLNDIETLVRNVERDKIVITSDHGNALGEWMVYGHPMHLPLSCLRKVPWAPVTAEYDGSHTPDPAHLTSEATGIDIGEQLSALGYTD